MLFILINLLFIVSRTYSQDCNYENSVELKNRTYNGIQFNDGEFYVENNTGIERGCICLKQKCIDKCCRFGKIFNSSSQTCDDNVEEFNPPVWEGGAEKEEFNFTKNFHVSQKFLTCDKNEEILLLSVIAEYFHLNTDGNLTVRESNSLEDSVYSPDKFCLDNFSDLRNTSAIKLGVMACISETSEVYFIVKASCMYISCIFIILTVAVYGFLPELRTTIHGKIMLAYLSSFFFGFLLVASTLYTLIFGFMSQFTCTIIAFIIYFWLLAAFFWLNVMSYDIYRKFNIITIYKDATSRFYWYCAYAFGMPTALTIILAGLEFSGLPKVDTLLPDIRKGRCFLSGNTRRVYLFIPILVLCAINLVLFLLVARRLLQITKDCKRLEKKHTQQLHLYVKLFILSGINWILDVTSDFYPHLDNLWIVTDSYNILVGLTVFIIFVCKKKVLFLLKQRYKQFRGIETITNKPTSISTSTNTKSVEDVKMENQEPRTNL